MPEKRRSVKYIELSVLINGQDAESTEMLRNTLYRLESMDPVDTVRDLKSSNKVVGIESIRVKDDGHAWVAFKSARYGYKAKLLNRNDGTERESDKTVDEGEIELTHICMRLEEKHAVCALEVNRYGITIFGIEEYLRLIDDRFHLSHSVLAADGIPDLIERSRRIISLDIYRPWNNGREDAFESLFDQWMKDIYVVQLRPKRGMSILKEAVLKLYDRIGPDQNVRGLHLRIKTDEGSEMVLDTLSENISDYIPAETDANGVVISTSMFVNLEQHLEAFERKPDA